MKLKIVQGVRFLYFFQGGLRLLANWDTVPIVLQQVFREEKAIPDWFILLAGWNVIWDFYRFSSNVFFSLNLAMLFRLQGVWFKTLFWWNERWFFSLLVHHESKQDHPVIKILLTRVAICRAQWLFDVFIFIFLWYLSFRCLLVSYSFFWIWWFNYILDLFSVFRDAYLTFQIWDRLS